ncbi:hypothetical protein HDV05_004667 [Chytridiales sp. JEL 0842]|nr:hypothetical protein HDV05_004667 [Chytridiales sp. JEL 0842]
MWKARGSSRPQDPVPYQKDNRPGKPYQVATWPKDADSNLAVANGANLFHSLMSRPELRLEDGQPRPIAIKGGALIAAQKQADGTQPRFTNDVDVIVEAKSMQALKQGIEAAAANDSRVTGYRVYDPKLNDNGEPIGMKVQLSYNHTDLNGYAYPVEMSFDVRTQPTLNETQKLKMNGHELPFQSNQDAITEKFRAATNTSRIADPIKQKQDLPDLKYLAGKVGPNGLSTEHTDLAIKYMVQENAELQRQARPYQRKQVDTFAGHFSEVADTLKHVASPERQDLINNAVEDARMKKKNKVQDNKVNYREFIDNLRQVDREIEASKTLNNPNANAMTSTPDINRDSNVVPTQHQSTAVNDGNTSQNRHSNNNNNSKTSAVVPNNTTNGNAAPSLMIPASLLRKRKLGETQEISAGPVRPNVPGAEKEDALTYVKKRTLSNVERYVGANTLQQVAGAKDTYAMKEAYNEAAKQDPANAPLYQRQDPTNTDTLLPYLLQQQMDFDSVTYAYFGTQRNGNFAAAGKANTAKPYQWQYLVQDNDQPLNSSCRLTCPQNMTAGNLHAFNIDPDGSWTNKRAVHSEPFPTRQRPWYTLVANQTEPVPRWSPVYVYSDPAHNVGITLSQPIFDSRSRLMGVAAVDLTFGTLASSLQNLALSPNGFALIFDANKVLFGSSIKNESSSIAVTQASGQITHSVKYITGLTEPTSRFAVNTLLEACKGDLSTLSSTGTYQTGGLIFQHFKYTTSHGLDLIILNGAQVTDFTAELEDTRSTLKDNLSRSNVIMVVIALALSFFLVVLSIPITYATISLPLQRLTRHMSEAAKFDFTSLNGVDRRVRSIIRELAAIENSYWHMVIHRWF